MKSIILCEGSDDQYILGYYLYNRTKGNNDCWKRIENKNDFSELFELTNFSVECYRKGDNHIAIVCVNGKDRFNKVFQELSNIFKAYPDEISNIVFVMDRDDNLVSDGLSGIKTIIESNLDDAEVSDLKNNDINTISFTNDNEEASNLNIIPIIIPFEENGAIETILMKGIKDNSPEENYIVDEAASYIGKLVGSGEIYSYLQKRRQILKAKFSSVIAVTNPDRSTGTYDKLLTSHEWYNNYEVEKHFKILIEKL